MVIADRTRRQPPPAHVVLESLATPNADPVRPWFELVKDEIRPWVKHVKGSDQVSWTSLWPRRPDLIITFTATPEPGGVGCKLRFTVTADATRPVDDALAGRVRYRLNQLINGSLRYSYGQ